MHGVAKLRPGAALHGPLTKSSVREFPSPGRGRDLDLIAVLIELVLYDLLDPVLVGPNHLFGGRRKSRSSPSSSSSSPHRSFAGWADPDPGLTRAMAVSLYVRKRRR
ncbi:hypothetical protein Pyn_11645 [Prunus yedoensis var. nudiflora]|uniref:Uncharacterized protein n=1 Tax=Prunus yedoensis var. nudiflora TaxID=2094558 RepID=A0A314UP48_PRUYE|nr:hypothetical protein Pyn_11645 [Prunus yedoensis var. nudiflora]